MEIAMWIADNWKDYEVIDCSKGEKLERWGDYLLVRPDPQVIYEEMSSEHPDVARVTEIAKNKNCRYIVFNTSFHQIPEDLTEYGYEKIAVIEDVYAVYSRIGS